MKLSLKRRLRPKKRPFGFTLIELMVAMSITSLLALIAIAGESNLQQRARFDASVNKTIQNLAYARNYAMSNVNDVGGGSNTSSLLVGTSVELDNRHQFSGYPLEEMAPAYAIPDAQGHPDLSNILEMPADAGLNPSECPISRHPADTDECFEEFFNLPEPLIMLDPNKPGYTANYKTEYNSPNVAIGILFFVNTGSGILVCHQTDTVQVDAGSACATSRSTPFDFVLVDENGLHATLEVDPTSGFAKRIN